jgi:hypothetical protein
VNLATVSNEYSDRENKKPVHFTDVNDRKIEIALAVRSTNHLPSIRLCPAVIYHVIFTGGIPPGTFYLNLLQIAININDQIIS